MLPGPLHSSRQADRVVEIDEFPTTFGDTPRRAPYVALVVRSIMLLPRSRRGSQPNALTVSPSRS